MKINKGPNQGPLFNTLFIYFTSFSWIYIFSNTNYIRLRVSTWKKIRKNGIKSISHSINQWINKYFMKSLTFMIRKIIIFVMVALAHGLDVALHDLIHVDFVQSIIIVAYIAGEFGSIIENLEKAGLGHVVPPVFKHILDGVNLYLDRQVDKHFAMEAKRENEKHRNL